MRYLRVIHVFLLYFAYIGSSWHGNACGKIVAK